jgi:tRNA1(Val) A37 N6-methylase TrmN6
VKTADSILDLGAGSGVIGIEVANSLKANHLTLVDVQSEWKEIQEYNLGHFLKSGSGEIIVSSFKDWIPTRKYDLIVCNPPYFLPGHGQPNNDPRKEIARSFVVDGWNELLRAIERSLSQKGTAFVVVMNDKRILNEIKSPTLKTSFEVVDELNFVSINLF